MLILILFAILAGAGTALSPCVLPLLPAFLSAGAVGGRRRPLGIVLGLSITFTVTIVGLADVVGPNVEYRCRTLCPRAEHRSERGGNPFDGGGGKRPRHKVRKKRLHAACRLEITCIHRLLGKPMVRGKIMREKKRKI